MVKVEVVTPLYIPAFVKAMLPAALYHWYVVDEPVAEILNVTGVAEPEQVVAATGCVDIVGTFGEMVTVEDVTDVGLQVDVTTH